MNGIGRTTGAITFVNALPTGVGAAAAVSLPVEARVRLTPVQGREPASFSIPPAADSRLSRASLLAGLRRYASEVELSASLEVDSGVPVARGLKSSSAVSTAIVLAIADAVGAVPDAVEVARLSADTSQAIGLSATGAFDDALASVTGGLVVTDNATRRPLHRGRFSEEWDIVLWVPRRPHPPSAGLAGAFRGREGEGRRAVELALSGAYWEAMGRNTELVERVLGYSYRPLREELRRQGAVASGVSGMGPTLATVAPVESTSTIVRALPRGEADVLTASFRPPDPAAGDFSGS